MAGYWVVKVRVSDAEAYGEYAKRAAEAVAAHGGRFLVRGQPAVTKEGGDYPRNVVVEFPSYEQALACYDSPAYKEALVFAKGA
ncbi:MAG: DUF1330 domain-containing protein, partial [Kiloniellales bacterium]|nr:DUF1330 domain-containing protein [Kiloniellales bacterium]